MRPLTRKEQLEYLIEFLTNQINMLQNDLDLAKVELEGLKKLEK